MFEIYVKVLGASPSYRPVTVKTVSGKELDKFFASKENRIKYGYRRID